MSAIPQSCVLDASVAIKLFVEEPLSEQAQRLMERLTADAQVVFHVPDLFFIECANVLLKYSRRFGRSLEDCQADLVDLGKLPLRVVSTAALMDESFSLAAQSGLSAYDACYAVLARRLNQPLITADEGLCKALSWAVWLGALDV